jgi:hypothetical protein
MKPTTLSKAEFKQLSPRNRGYSVYMYGCREDHPNIPDEKNPYPKDSQQAKEWEAGAFAAMLQAQDSEE